MLNAISKVTLISNVRPHLVHAIKQLDLGIKLIPDINYHISITENDDRLRHRTVANVKAQTMEATIEESFFSTNKKLSMLSKVWAHHLICFHYDSENYSSIKNGIKL